MTGEKDDTSDPFTTDLAIVVESHDDAIESLFKVCLQLAKNCMELGVTLRDDPGLSKESKEAATKVFYSVGPMLEELQFIEDSWFPSSSSEEGEDGNGEPESNE